VDSEVASRREPAGVEVVEPDLPDRIRLPSDLLRVAVYVLLLAALLALGTFASETSVGVESDVAEAVSLLPGPVLFVVNLVVGFGFLGLPIIIGIDLLLRRRSRILLDALLAVAVAILVVAALDALVLHTDTADLLGALVRPGSASNPFSALLAGVSAYFAVARVGDRRLWLVAAWAVILSFVVTALIAGQATLLSMVASLVLGLVIGFAMRYALGTQASRPSGDQIAAALQRAGLPVTRLVRRFPDGRDGRRYQAEREGGAPLDVRILDQDQEGAGLAARAWRIIRVRKPVAGRMYVSVRRSLEHEALLTFAATSAGARTPALVATTEVGPYAALLAYESPDARPLADLDPEAVTDATLKDGWAQLAALRRARVAHRNLSTQTVLVAEDGSVTLVGLRGGEVAATDLTLRIDVAQLLTTFALVAGPERAVGTAAEVLGTERLAQALPVLQPLALTVASRQAVRHNKQLLHGLRAAILDALPKGVEVPDEEARLERVSARTLFVIVGGSIAGYIVLTQLSNVDIGTLISSADWRWGAVALVFSMITYVGAAFSLTGFVLQAVSWVRAFLAQVAASFVSLVAPPAVGGMALNARFLQKSGVDPPVAVATVGVWQAMAFLVHIVMLLLFGVVAGTQAETSFDPPQGAVLGAVGLILVAAVVIGLPWGRRVIVSRVTDLAGRVIPALYAVAQRPRKLAEGIGGNILLNLAYCGALVACVRAFGGELAWPAIAVVYLTGSAIGSAAPTPGGLGAVEAALAAGLTAAGLDGATAVSAVLLFRVLTYWLPVAPGWAAFQYLQRKGAL
jgi:uncharacterized membrane protein YbhN (UPF0104 family)